MRELETRLGDMAKQALELLKTMEAVRMEANEAGWQGQASSPLSGCCST